ncbi:MAG: hypothetical protein RL154_1205 [Pseudomonadota bacterium]|jgi:cupin superfamily acireductone dioxygenase involved in methionine salvage
MATWVLLDDFAKATGQTKTELYGLCDDGKLAHKIEDDEYYIEAATGTQLILGSSNDVEVSYMDAEFAQNAINAIVAMQDKVVEAKDETIEALKSENAFLKEGLLSMQEVYDQNLNTIKALQDEMAALREDLEFSKRKYKLMWDQTVATHAQNG